MNRLPTTIAELGPAMVTKDLLRCLFDLDDNRELLRREGCCVAVLDGEAEFRDFMGGRARREAVVG